MRLASVSDAEKPLAFPAVTWQPIPGGIAAPRGFRAAGVAAGLKPSGLPDLALLLAPEQASCAGSFTTNLVRAACVDLCAQRLQQCGGRARAVIINAGQANACLGERELSDSLRITAAVAAELGLAEEAVQICSTGVIGQPIPMDTLLAGLGPLLASLSRQGGAAAAQAILTTDLVAKDIALEADLAGRTVRIGGMAKGSGMIHPAMATMLAVLSCDAGVEPRLWQAIVDRAVERSFNAVSVDGDTSTNDTCLAFAAGPPLAAEQLAALEEGVMAVCTHLAKAIARDGEGATCLLEVAVEGAASAADARSIARTVCASSLVKTAIHGRDPNWGRIVAAVGRAGVPLDAHAIALWLGDTQLMAAGRPLSFDRQAVSAYLEARAAGAYLRDDSVAIRIAVGDGSGAGLAWGCDLSDQYIRINADYTT